MIKFFRQIRFKLMSENRTGKYLKYALGEIILVVIGILIALQINNSNETNQNRKKIEQILVDIQSDLILHGLEANDHFNNHIYEDSVQNIILSNAYTIDDYKQNRAFELGKYYSNFTLSTDSYDNLMLNRAELDQEFAGLAEILSIIYVHNKVYIEDYNKRLKETVYQYLDKRYYQPWSQNWVKGIKDDRAIDYFMNSEEYRGYILKFMNDANNLTKEVNSFRYLAAGLYSSIDSLLGKKNELPKTLDYRISDPDEKKGLIGNYSVLYKDGNILPNSIAIKELDNVLHIIHPDFGETPLLKHNDSTYFTPYSGGILVHNGVDRIMIKLDIGGVANYIKN